MVRQCTVFTSCADNGSSTGRLSGKRRECLVAATLDTGDELQMTPDLTPAHTSRLDEGK